MALARRSLRGGTSNPPPTPPPPRHRHRSICCVRGCGAGRGLVVVGLVGVFLVFFLCGFCVIIEACWQECRSVSSRGQQKHLVREKIIGVSGVCVCLTRAAPPPRSAACVCRDPGEIPGGGGGTGRRRARCGGPFPVPPRSGGGGGGRSRRDTRPGVGCPPPPRRGEVTKPTQRRPARPFRVPRGCRSPSHRRLCKQRRFLYLKKKKKSEKNALP